MKVASRPGAGSGHVAAAQVYETMFLRRVLHVRQIEPRVDALVDLLRRDAGLGLDLTAHAARGGDRCQIVLDLGPGAGADRADQAEVARRATCPPVLGLRSWTWWPADATAVRSYAGLRLVPLHAMNAGGSQMIGAAMQAAVASTSEKLRADALLSAAKAGCNNSATGRAKRASPASPARSRRPSWCPSGWCWCHCCPVN